MTNITLKRENGYIVSFEVKGHSGFAPEGEDIVCASISSVVWTVINGLENVLGLGVSYKAEDGYVSCKLPPLSENERKMADVLLESMSRFFDDLEENYGRFISKTEV